MNAVVKSVSDHTPEFRAALTRLTLRKDATFFVAMLYNMRHERYDPLVVRGQRTPACTDGTTIMYDGELFGKDSLDDRLYTLVHEILHVVLLHATRRGAREPNLWNIACDYVVNGMIHDQKAFTIPKTDIQPDPAFQNMSAEQVYDALQKEAQQALSGGKQSGKGQNGREWVRGTPGPDGVPVDDGNGPSTKGFQNDLSDYNPNGNDQKTAQQAERDIGIATEKALAAAKAAGQGSESLRGLLREAQVKKEPWYTHLRRYMTASNDRTYNWAHIHRRRAVLHGIISPDLRSESMGKAVLSVDESGSLTDSQEAAIAAHTKSIMEEVRPRQLVVVRHTDRVTDVEVYEGPDYVGFELVRKSTGGTDFRPVFEFVIAEHADAQVVLMFTDMYGPMPAGFAIDTVWVTSTEEAQCPTPFGERIQADFND